MDSDNLYPLDGKAFTEEVQHQEDERRIEKGKALAARPLLEDIIERLAARVDFYGSVDSIPPEVKADPQKFLIMHNANQLTRDNLRVEMEWLEELLLDER